MQLRLRNFQAWEDASLDLSGLVTIVGDSSLGKSSFGRAIRKVLRNEVLPGNIRFKATKVEIDLEHKGLDIHVERGAKPKDSPIYRVGGEVFEKLGGDVPEVMKAMRFGPVDAGGATIDPNFAGQFDQQFLVGAKPAELNAVLNAFASTEKLDRGRKAMAMDIKDCDAQAKALGVQIDALQEQQASLQEQIALATEPLAKVRDLSQSTKRLGAAQSSSKSFLAAREEFARDSDRMASVEATTGGYRIALTKFKAASQGRTLQEARRVAQEASQHVEALTGMSLALVTPTTPLKALEALRVLGETSRMEGDLRTKLGFMEALPGALAPCLVLHKARVRVKVLLESNPEPIRDLLGQVQDISLAHPVALYKTGIILGKLTGIREEMASLAKDLEQVAQEMAHIQDEQNAIETEIENARREGVLATCPKCGYEFTAQHDH